MCDNWLLNFVVQFDYSMIESMLASPSHMHQIYQLQRVCIIIGTTMAASWWKIHDRKQTRTEERENMSAKKLMRWSNPPCPLNDNLNETLGTDGDMVSHKSLTLAKNGWVCFVTRKPQLTGSTSDWNAPKQKQNIGNNANLREKRQKKSYSDELRR